MKLIDISWPIFLGMTEYKNRGSLELKKIKTIERDRTRETIICMNVHTGTHVDSPSHFIADGKTIDNVEPGSFMGPCRVLDFMQVSEKITRADLEQHELKEGEIILCKTQNSNLSEVQQFNPSFIYLDASAACYCVEQKIRTIGIDYLGIERNQPDHETHYELLSHDIPIIEGLRLSHVEPGSYFLICLPLSVIGLGAAPARAVLLIES